MFIPKHGVIYCSNECLKNKCSSQNAANTTLTNSQPSSPIKQTSSMASNIASPKYAQQIDQQQTTSARVNYLQSHNNQQHLSSPTLTSTQYNRSNEEVFDRHLLNNTSLHNQSRSRKPFNLTEYDTNPILSIANQQTNLKQVNKSITIHSPSQSKMVQDIPSMALQHKRLLMLEQQNGNNNSFDDLDSVEVINLNQHQLVRSRHSFSDLNNRDQHLSRENEQPYRYGTLKSSMRSSKSRNEYNQENFCDQHLENSKRPLTSILKRFDSNEKMYPINRPTGLNISSYNKAAKSNQLLSEDADGSRGTLPRMQRRNQACNSNDIYSSINDESQIFNEPFNYDMNALSNQTLTDITNTNSNRHSQRTAASSSSLMNQTTGRQTKRVQFANIPPLSSASSTGDIPFASSIISKKSGRSDINSDMLSNSTIQSDHRHERRRHQRQNFNPDGYLSNDENHRYTKHRSSSTHSSHKHHHSERHNNRHRHEPNELDHSRRTHRQHHEYDQFSMPHHHQHRHHHHNHKSHRKHVSHRRSSSTNNFNTSTISSKSYNMRGTDIDTSRKLSNRSLNQYYGEADCNQPTEDYYSASACECDGDEYNMCSTCSSSGSNTTSSTTSTESDDSDMEDFGYGASNFYFNQGNPSGFNRSINLNKLDTNAYSSSAVSSNSKAIYQSRFNNGLKISYVDSLPLARTNPLPTGENKKSSKTKSDKKKSLSSKFKKDNCVVS
jgi:hypothetical protein